MSDPDSFDIETEPAPASPAEVSSDNAVEWPAGDGLAALTPWDQPAAIDIDPFAEIVGDAVGDTRFWQPQTTAFTCAVVAQRGVIEAMTGEAVSEAQLVYEATASGCLTDGGMSPYDVGSLLDDYGVPNHVVQSAGVSDLVAELTLGHKVIVGVDSGELWNTDGPLEDFFGQAADHAIWVTGVDMTDPTAPKVIINDSGDPNGAGRIYELDRFVDAWQDSGFFYVATDHAPPDYVVECGAFDPVAGHIPALASYFGAQIDGFDASLKEPLGGAGAPADPDRPKTLSEDEVLRRI